MSKNEIIQSEEIQSLIYSIRGLQVMLDRNLAKLYNVETRVLNQAVKRNWGRFPVEFCFQLTDKEFEDWKSQIVMSNEDKMGLRRPPYAFTEQGVAMLSSVLHSETAIKVSIRIMNAFVGMRRFILSNAQVFQRLDTLELKQIETDNKVEKVLNALSETNIKPKQEIFFEGQIFDAHKFISDLIRSAKRSIILIDNYIDEGVLTLFTKRGKGVLLQIYTKKITRQLALDSDKFKKQYPPMKISEFGKSHDRFMIIDDKTVYHIGASLKDIGKKWFAFSKMDIEAVDMLEKLKKQD
ncbi:MAG: ORF6N domain-containing protein [Candidatus Cloacimonetes bacterium]|nr:ORF6N domain-containing protein [Candidatus Cloacimonadota bacterium]